MGGDLGPQPSLEAALICLDLFPRLHIRWFGPASQLHNLVHEAAISKVGLLDRLTLVDAPEVVELTDDVAVALRQKQQSSMYMALQDLALGQADVCVSSGNSAALMAFSRQLLDPIDGFDRPAFASHVPTSNYSCLIVDMGANLFPNAQQLIGYAVAGYRLESALAPNGKVTLGLLNIAGESGKGQPQVNQAHQALNDLANIDYIGFVEPQEVFQGKVNVLVCDGYAGNIMIKTAEGVSQLINSALATRIAGHENADRLCEQIQQPLQQQFDPRKFNGAFMLGLQRLVIKSHSYADATALKAALIAAVQYLDIEVTARLT